MAERRQFKVTANVRVWKTVEYLVRAESFDEAESDIRNGYYDDVYDECEDDSEIESVDCVECYECDQSEGDCECESEDVFAELGL